MEIERKWLVRKEDVPYDLAALDSVTIEQAYLSFSPVIRVRRVNGGEKCVLTVKGGASGPNGLAREEHEIPITDAQYERLLAKKEGEIILKTRFFFRRADGLLEEIDVFRDALEPLCYLEIEFPTVAAAEDFPSPDWVTADVTGIKGFNNGALAARGVPPQAYLLLASE